MLAVDAVQAFPRALSSYPDLASDSLAHILLERARLEPFNAVATCIFFAAILHTFAAPFFATRAHAIQHRHDARARATGEAPTPTLAAEALHFLGEVEVVFGLWA